jgi:pectate lyase-like protein
VRGRHLALLAVLFLARSLWAQPHPATYAEFDTSIDAGDGKALKKQIEAKQVAAIYLRPGRYALANPVKIDRTSPLFLHCADRHQTTLVARDPSRPLFVVENAPLLNVTGCKIFPAADEPSASGAVAFAFVNRTPVTAEFQDCTVDHAQLSLAGPGAFRVQSCVFAPNGRVASPVLVDDDRADVLVVGGGFSNGSAPLARGIDEAYHVWQRRGRIRIYLTTSAGARGRADFRVETGSALGPHVIASARSEGSNGTTASRLLFVPPTASPVDVVIKNSDGAWPIGPRGDEIHCKLVDYNGAGTLWLLGNILSRCGAHLVEGNARGARIVSVGNVLSSPTPFAVKGARSIASEADLWNHYYATGLKDQSPPMIRFLPDAGVRDDRGPPPDPLPPALTRPAVTSALPGMLDVKAQFGAVGNGEKDDTAALQAALDARCDPNEPKLVFLPPGTYRVSDTLRLNHHQGRCRSLNYGGWIAGAGSARTTIAMAPGVKKGVFASDGLGIAAIQGITFRTWKWQQGDPTEPNIDLEAYAGLPVTGNNSLYDIVSDGGYAGFATGVRYNEIQCDSTVAFQSRFQNAQIGFASGHSNAIANAVYDAEFVNNAYAMAGGWVLDATSHGGSFRAIHGTSRGTTVRDFITTEAAIYGLYGWDSDAPAYISVGVTDNPYALWIEDAQLNPRAAVEFPFSTGAGHGVIFLRSRLARGAVRVGQGSSDSYAVSIESEIPDWKKSVRGQRGRLQRPER